MKELIQNLLKLQSLEFGESETEHNLEIANLRGVIPSPILGHYDRLCVNGKKGIVALRNQVCTGCHMHLPLGVVMTLRHGTDIQLCDNCGRYLYLEEEKSSASENPILPVKPVKSRTKRSKAVAAV